LVSMICCTPLVLKRRGKVLVFSVKLSVQLVQLVGATQYSAARSGKKPADNSKVRNSLTALANSGPPCGGLKGRSG
jgi:hypothetical protein